VLSVLPRGRLVELARELAVALHHTGRKIDLLLLWYCPGKGTSESNEMARELAVLHEVMSADQVTFRSLTYQQLFARLRDRASGMPDSADYPSYLENRYFGGDGAP
jgi:hypothetical protein